MREVRETMKKGGRGTHTIHQPTIDSGGLGRASEETGQHRRMSWPVRRPGGKKLKNCAPSAHFRSAQKERKTAHLKGGGDLEIKVERLATGLQRKPSTRNVIRICG